jgi:hypothetical protein
MTEAQEQQLLIDSLKLDLQYAQADYHDINHENKMLRVVLNALVKQVREDIPEEQGSKHLWTAVEDAEFYLGLEE